MTDAIEKQDRPKAVCLLSGGLDSTTAVARMLKLGYDVIALSINYNQRHKIELDRAIQIVQYFKNLYADDRIAHCIIPLDGNGGIAHTIMGGSALTGGGEVPEGHYTDASMKATVVPNRNMILISLATALAIGEKACYVVYAAHAGDHAIYPDCRPGFAMAMMKAVIEATDGEVNLLAPFIQQTKAGIVKDNNQFGWQAPYHLTWSCYKGAESQCAICGTCQERRIAFIDAGIPDPTIYDPAGIAKVPDSALRS